MNTSFKINRWIVGGALVALLAIVLIACGGGGDPQAQQEEERSTALSINGNADGSAKRDDGHGGSKGDRATNTPRRIDQTLFAGTSTTLHATLIATEDARNAELWISPALRPYVTVTPFSFDRIREGNIVELSIAIRAPINARPTTATGTLQLRERDGRREKGELLARPLPVRVDVAVQTTGTIRAGNASVSFAAPAGWRVIQGSGETPGANIYNPRSVEEIASGGEMTPPDVTITIEQLQSALAPDAYVNSQANGWYTYFKNRVGRTISGYPALVVDDLNASVPKYPIATAFVFIRDHVIVITGDQTSSSDFETVLANIRIQ